MENTDQDPKPTPNATPVMDIQPPKPAASVPEGADSAVVAAPPEQPADTAQSATAEPEAVAPLIATPGKDSHHHRAPIGAIIVAVIVAGALAAVSVLAYTKYQQKPQTATTTESQVTTQPKEEVKASDVDDTTKALDDSLNEVNEAADYNTEDLSDTSLSL